MPQTTSRFRSFLLPTPASPGRGTDLGLLALRLGFGLSMGLTHGVGMLRGFLTDPGAYPDPIGLGSELSMGLMVFAELVCALLVAAGLFTRLAAIPPVIGMAVAVLVRHAGDPFGERELALLYLVAYVAVLCAGPGRFSLDRLLFGGRGGEGGGARKAGAVAVLALLACAPPGSTRPEDPADSAEALVRRGLGALGGPEALVEAGGLSIEGEGWLDLSIRMQGTHPDRPERVPATRLLAFDPASGRVGFESHAVANPDADEWVRFVHDDSTGEAGMLIALPLEGRAFRVPGNPEQRRRTLRAVPHVLLADALERRATLRRVDGTDGERAVAVTLESGETVTLLFDPASGHLVAFEFPLDLPLRGDTVVRWEYLPHREVPGLGAYPSGHRVLLGERPLEEIRYTAVRAGGAGAGVLGVPAGIEPPPPFEPPPPPPEPPAGREPAPTDAPPPPTLQEIADGVHLVPNVRGGFHPLIVELADAVVVVDAPAGYHEFQTVPAIDWAGEVTSSSVGRRLLTAVRSVAPEKPIHLVLTHHHGDHAGGVRPFLAAGATVHASAVTAEVVRQAARASFTLEPDELTGRDVDPDLRVVDGETTISDGERSVRILDVGENPHAEGLLVVHLPKEGILYQSDVLVASGGELSPDPARLPAMRWFVGWLDAAGLSEETVYSIHGTPRIPAELLDRIRALGE